MLVESSIYRAKRIVSILLSDPSVEFIGSAMNLTQAHDMAAKERPGLVLVARELVSQSNFALFANQLEQLNVQYRSLPGDAVGFGTVSQMIDPSVSLGSEGQKQRDDLGKQQKRMELSIPIQWRTVVVGASTGGVEALQEVLSMFPEECPPTLVVQHIQGRYLDGLAGRLNRHCRARVKPADVEGRIMPGQVVLAPGNDRHLVVDPSLTTYRLVSGASVSGHRPSVDVLFESAACLAHDTVGVILTGMGEDGARGLQSIRAAGGHTIGQNQETCSVYGMPKAAEARGAVMRSLPLSEIGNAILTAAALKRERSNHG